MLALDASGAYAMAQPGDPPVPTPGQKQTPPIPGIPSGLPPGIPTVDQPAPDLATQYSIGKDSIDNVYCTELESSSSMPEEKAAIALTLNDKSEYPIFDKDIAAWKELYPNVDILQELRKMKGWLNSNPTRRKTKKGILKFVNAWLAKEQDKGGYRNYGANTSYSTTSGGQHQEQEPECFSDKWLREKREAAEARGETFDIEEVEYDF